MRIGVHMRTGGDLLRAAQKAADIGCETVQVFAANPNAWRSAVLRPEVAVAFRELTRSLDLHPVAVHTPYLLNLASSDDTIHSKSTTALIESLERAYMLGAQYVVTHIGSHRGGGVEQGIANVCKGVATAFDRSIVSVKLLLENSAGSGDSLGAAFQELRTILDCTDGYQARLGICLDTAHLWGAGYDISGQAGIDRAFSEFDSVVGIQWLHLLHLNDSRVALGSRKDRHANIGTGSIGEAGFAAMLHHPKLADLAGVIETPARTIEDDIRDIDILKRLR